MLKTETIPYAPVPKRKFSQLIAATACILIGPGILFAQEEKVETEEIFELSPFEVNAADDVGYITSNSTSGTRLNMELKKIPMMITTVNEEFIRDIGATDIEEAMTYQSGVFFETFEQGGISSASATGGGSVSNRSASAQSANLAGINNSALIRGFRIDTQVRDGFRIGGSIPSQGITLGGVGVVDSVNIYRLETVKGPGALLYGVGVLSGIVNVLPKKPLEDPFFETTVSAGDEGYFRASLDATGPVAGGLLYRFAAAYQENEAWYDHYSREKEVYVGQLEKDFWDRRLRVFLEYTYAENRENGTGPRSLFDVPATFINSDQLGGFSRDAFLRADLKEERAAAGQTGEWTTYRFDKPVSEQYKYPFQNRWEGAIDFVRDPYTLDGETWQGGMPASYNIGGPDAYQDREEWSFLADIELQPVEQVIFKVGVFQQGQELERFFPTFRVFNNRVLTAPPTVGNSPETDILGTLLYGTEAYGRVLPENLITHVDVAPHPLYDYAFAGSNGDAILALNHYIDPVTRRLTPFDNDDYKTVGYYWQKSPLSTESTQVRAEVNLQHETQLLGGEKHSLLLGYHYIEDLVTYMTNDFGARGNNGTPYEEFLLRDRTPVWNGERWYVPSSEGPGFSVPDALTFRNPTNIEPVRYAGESALFNTRIERETQVYLKGSYFVYTGEFFKDKLTIIGGMRRDAYQVKDSSYYIDFYDYHGNGYLYPDVMREELLNIHSGEDNINDITSNFMGTGQRMGPVYRFDGQNVAPEREGAEAQIGIRQFPQEIVENTGTFAASYAVTDAINIFATTSGGILPNTGWKDGNNEAIQPEVTRNYEIGLRFETEDKKFSGSLSVFAMDREHGVMQLSHAPNPQAWAGNRDISNTSDPNLRFVETDPVRYGIRMDYLPVEVALKNEVPQYMPPAVKALGYTDMYFLLDEKGRPVRENGQLVVAPNPNAYPGLTASSGWAHYEIDPSVIFGNTQDVIDRYMSNTAFLSDEDKALHRQEVARRVQLMREWVIAAWEQDQWADGTKGPFWDEISEAAETNVTAATSRRAILRNGNTSAPFHHNRAVGGQYNGLYNNPSFASGLTNVEFEDRTEGYEFNLIWNPFKDGSWQVVFNYSHVEQEIKKITFAAPYSNEQDAFFFSPWDSWVWFFGREAFDDIEDTTDPETGEVIYDTEGGDPRTFNGANVYGKSFYFGPEDSARLFSRYIFKEGQLEGFSVFGGVRWDGPARTSTDFGRPELERNRYLTPDQPDRFVLDAGCSYVRNFENFQLRLALNISNLLDDTSSFAEAKYVDDDGEVHYRRTQIYHAPRSYKISASLSF